MTDDTSPQISELTSDRSVPIQVEDLTYIEETQHVLETEGHQSGKNLTRRQAGEVRTTNDHVGLHATLFQVETTRSNDEQQVLGLPPSRPSQDRQGHGSLGGCTVPSKVDDFTTLISKRFGTRVQQGDRLHPGHVEHNGLLGTNGRRMKVG
ncbi:hypothetical protein Tco_0971954 [Tanacetum coccineum]